MDTLALLILDALHIQIADLPELIDSQVNLFSLYHFPSMPDRRGINNTEPPKWEANGTTPSPQSQSRKPPARFPHNFFFKKVLTSP